MPTADRAYVNRLVRCHDGIASLDGRNPGPSAVESWRPGDLDSETSCGQPSEADLVCGGCGEQVRHWPHRVQ